jgi:uncharacterized protein (TIGR03437 family)
MRAFFLCLVASASLHAALICNDSAATPILRSEGLTEQVGDIILACSGGVPGTSVSGNLNVFLSTNVTNKVSAQGFADAILTIDMGSGPLSSSVQPQILGPSQIGFNGLTFTVPATGNVTLRVSNIRVVAPATTEVAILSFSASAVSLSNPTLSVGIAQPALLASLLTGNVAAQQGSPLPDTINFANLLSTGTRFATTRITAATFGAFQPRQPMTDNGMRIIVQYSNFPGGTRLFVPDTIAGSDATQPTSAGDFGLTPSPGQYASGSGTLLLVRVMNADVNGAGGSTLAPIFGSVGELSVVNGAAQAVYEIVDASATARETAQIPAFIGLAPISNGGSIVTQQKVFLGPVSTVVTASTTAPVPRFTGTTPASDCTLLSDCNGPYLPKLFVDAPPLTQTLVSGGGFALEYVRVLNHGGGVLVWNLSVAYQNGSDWLRVDTLSGIGQATTRIDFLPANLTPGIYHATVTIDGGPQAGRMDLPVTLTVTAAVPPAPAITKVINAATLQAGALVRGSFGTLMGTNLLAPDTAVTLDGTPVKTVYIGATQINFLVPPTLPREASAQLVVTANGQRTAALTVPLADVAPGIFNPGILNQDNTVNSATNPALVGSVVQVFATGLLPPEGGTVDVTIQDRQGLVPLYAGAAPGIPGLQQVNVMVPSGLTATTTQIVICGTALGNRVCSPPAQITLRQ